MEQVLYNHAFPGTYDNFISDVTKENNDRTFIIAGILVLTVIGIGVLYKHNQLIKIQNKTVAVNGN